MSETTTQPPTPALTPELREQLRALLNLPGAAELYGQKVQEDREAAKVQREKEAAEQAARFKEIRESVSALVGDIHITHQPKNFMGKKDTKREGQVTGRGYHVTGVATLPDDEGVMRETRVTIFVKWNPAGGSAPAETVDGNSDDGASEGDGTSEK